MRRLAIAVSIPLAAAAGVASASVVASGAAGGQPPAGQAEAPAASASLGEPVADPRGGPPWVVRVVNAQTPWRCIAVGRSQGLAFGPVDASGAVRDTAAIVAGSCADPGAQPLQVALAEYADTAGKGPRSVLYGIAESSVASVAAIGPDGPQSIALGASSRTFAVVRQGLSTQGGWTVIAALQDGTSRTYRL